MSLADAHRELRQVALAQVALAHDGVERVALGLGSAVHGEVLDRGDRLQIRGIVALQSADELHAERSGEEGILAIGLLPASPAWIAEQVDVRRPEREALIAAVAVVAQVLVVLRPPLVRDHRRLARDERGVPGGRHADRLRKHRREPRPRDAVERLVPPVVGRDAEPRDRGCDVDHLRDLLFERHAPDEIRDARLERKRLVLERERGRRLGRCRGGDARGAERDGDGPAENRRAHAAGSWWVAWDGPRS